MKLKFNTDKIVIGIIPLLKGNGGNYIATNLAYSFSNTFKQKKKIALINMREQNDLAGNLIIGNDGVTNHLKFNIDLYNESDIETFNRVRAEYDVVIVVLDYENLELFNSYTKKKTNILVMKKNRNNLKKLQNEIEKIKNSNIKYSIFNCPEKTNKINFNILKENEITNIANIPYNELTVDNCNVESAHKIKKIKHLKPFSRISFLKIKITK